MPETLRILVIEDLEDDAILLQRCLKQAGYGIVCNRVDNARDLRQALEEDVWDIVLSDYNMPGFSGLEALNIIHEDHPDLPFIVVSGAIGEETAVSLVKAGAADYVMKHNLERLATAVDRALREAKERRLYREAQTQLKHSEKKFRNLFEGAGDAIFFYETDGRILEVNQTACECTGRSRAELLAMNVRQLTSGKFADGFAARMTSLEEENVLVYESMLVKSDGTSLPIEVNSRLIDYQGRPAVLSILRDIMERKQAANALHEAMKAAEEARGKIDAILQSVIDGLLVIDNNGLIILINREAARLLRIERQDVIGHHISEIINQKILCNELQTALEGRLEQGPLEWDNAIPGQKNLQTIQAGVSLVRNREGTRTGVIATLRDITRYRELDRMKSEFVTVAAHELSTPLATIMGFAELLINQPELSKDIQRESLQYIYEKTEALEKIVDELLNLSRIEYGLQHRLTKRACVLNDSITTLIQQYRKKNPQHTFELSLPPGPISLDCDRQRIIQVMENLLDNAVKFTRPAKTIRVDAEEIDSRYQITIRDEGCGMSPEQVERIFDKFYRGENGNTSVGGLGLGMSIAESIVKAHGGDIHVRSRPEQGTTVVIELPKTIH